MVDRSSPAYLVLSVVITCAVSAAGLSATYAATSERIAEQERAAEERALKAVLPAAGEFETLDEGVLEDAREAAGDTPVDALYVGKDAAGDPIGWGIRVGPRGYGGPIRMVVGVDRDGKVSGISIVTANETPGLGSRVLEDASYLDGFVGVEVREAESSLRRIDAITGATKTSNGVEKGVVAAGAVFMSVDPGEVSDE